MGWDKVISGCIYSGLVSVAALGTSMFSDGVTRNEVGMALLTFVGGVFLYLKTHPAPPWDGVDRREGRRVVGTPLPGFNDVPIEARIVKVQVPGAGEVRRFEDPRLQDAVDYAAKKAEENGKKNAIVMQMNVEGEARLGVLFKKGEHFSFGGFLEKKPKQKLAGLAEVVISF